MSYNDAYVFRGSIKNTTSEQRMPPWKANSSEVEYVDDLSLTQAQINLIAGYQLPAGGNIIMQTQVG